MNEISRGGMSPVGTVSGWDGQVVLVHEVCEAARVWVGWRERGR